MRVDTRTITPEIARHVLWHFGEPGGWKPGSFTQNLIRTIEAADVPNTAILAAAYPAYTAAVLLATNSEQGVRHLGQMAGVGA